MLSSCLLMATTLHKQPPCSLPADAPSNVRPPYLVLRDTCPVACRFAPYCVTLSFRTPHCLFLVALVLPASFCSIHSSGQHNMATLILSVCAELVGLPSFSPPLDQKVSRTLAETVNFAACSLPSVKTKTRNPLRSSLQAGGIFWRRRRGFAYCRSDSVTELQFSLEMRNVCKADLSRDTRTGHERCGRCPVSSVLWWAARPTGNRSPQPSCFRFGVRMRLPVRPHIPSSPAGRPSPFWRAARVMPHTTITTTMTVAQGCPGLKSTSTVWSRGNKSIWSSQKPIVNGSAVARKVTNVT